MEAAQKEVVIGTSDYEAGEERTTERAELADVEAHLAQIRTLLLRGTLGSQSPAGLSFAAVKIRADDVRRIDELHDLLDQVHYWAIEEGTAYAAEPSLLAQAEAPEAVYACIACGRPRLTASAMTIAAHLVRHPQSASELRRVARAYRAAAAAPSLDSSDDPAEHPATALLQLAADGMDKCLGRADVCAAAARLAAEVVLLDPSAAVPALQCGMVAAVLAALGRHTGDRDVQREATRLLAVLVKSSGEADEGNAGEGATAPLAVLFCNAGAVREFVMRALESNWNSLEVKRWGLEFLCVCSRYAANTVPLLQCGAYGVSVRALREAVYTPDTFTVAAEAVGNFIAALDDFQTRSLVFVLRGGLLRRTDMESQMILLALLYSVLRHLHLDEPRPQRFSPYLLYRMPPGMAAAGVQQQQAGGQEETRGTRALQLSERLNVSTTRDWVYFFLRLRMPQVVTHLMDYYSSRHSVAESSPLDEEEEKSFLKLRVLADNCFRMLAA